MQELKATYTGALWFRSGISCSLESAVFQLSELFVLS